MGLTKYEMEVHVMWNRESDEAEIYTSDPSVMRKLSKLEAYHKTREHRNGGQIVALEFTCDKHLISFRSKRLTVELTDEERELRRERAKAIRAKQLESKTTPRNG